MQTDILGQNFTDVWNAERVFDRFQGIIRYCHTKKQYYIWNGALWEPDKSERIHELCQMHLSDMIGDRLARDNRDLLRHLIKSHTPTGVRNILFFLQANRINVTEDELDANPDRINVLNGVMNLKTVEYETPDRYRFITKRMNVKYDPSATCPLWMEHLKLIFNNDTDTIKSFQMIAGYSLLRENPEQIFFIAHGNGENGKSVTFNVIAFIHGEYAKSADYRTFIHHKNEKDGSSHCSDIVRLFGSHQIIAEEGTQGGRLNEALIKQITGHAKITGRGAYEKTEISDFLEGKVFFLTNHEPDIRDTTHAMLRRIIKIPFDVQIPPEKRDDKIEDKLKAEAPGIFNWMLDGLRAWHKNKDKIQLSKRITDATTELRDAIDEYREFFTDDIEKTTSANDSISKKTLYEYFLQWYTDKHGEYPSIKLKEFNKICKEHGIIKDERKTDGYYWTHLKHLSALDLEKKRAESTKRILEMQKEAADIRERWGLPT